MTRRFGIAIIGTGMAVMPHVRALNDLSDRIAVTGSKASPELQETIAAIGPELCRQRLRLAVDKLASLPAAS